MLFGEAKSANLGRPNVSILGVANVLRPSELPPNKPTKSPVFSSPDQKKINEEYRRLARHSPRAKRARAVTVSQCPHSEVGQDFLLRRRVTLTETAVTRKRKV